VIYNCPFHIMNLRFILKCDQSHRVGNYQISVAPSTNLLAGDTYSDSVQQQLKD
jgi:hypothetical protein